MKKAVVFIILTVFLLNLSICETSANNKFNIGSIKTYRDIPGVTEQEIAEIENNIREKLNIELKDNLKKIEINPFNSVENNDDFKHMNILEGNYAILTQWKNYHSWLYISCGNGRESVEELDKKEMDDSNVNKKNTLFPKNFWKLGKIIFLLIIVVIITIIGIFVVLGKI